MYKLKGLSLAYIYKVTNEVNGKIYIGKSKTNNPAYFGSGLKILSAIKKYGIKNFTKSIIEECPDHEVNTREIHWINFFQSTNDGIGYNISRGGTGGAHYWETLSVDEKKQHNQKISQARQGQTTGPRSSETKKKQSLSFNRDPSFLKRRADARRKLYTCVNHSTNEIFVTKNLKEFCQEKNINLASMQHNARTKKTFSNKCWSCRKGELKGAPETIIQKLTSEVAVATMISRTKISVAAQQKAGNRNSNAKRITLEHKSGKIVEFNGNFVKEVKHLTGYSYHTMKRLADNTVTELHGWRII